MCVAVGKPSPTTEDMSKCFVVLIIVSSLMTVSLIINVCLTVCLLRVKGTSTCVKGDSLCLDYFYITLISLYAFAFLIN